MPKELPIGRVYTIPDGKIVRGREYMNPERPSKPWVCGSKLMSQENVEIVRRLTQTSGAAWTGCSFSTRSRPTAESYIFPPAYLTRANRS